jgi:hypothetical protein
MSVTRQELHHAHTNSQLTNSSFDVRTSKSKFANRLRQESVDVLADIDL